MHIQYILKQLLSGHKIPLYAISNLPSLHMEMGKKKINIRTKHQTNPRDYFELRCERQQTRKI